MASTAWTCDCGRRVPPYIVTCRCGAKRPADAGGVSAPPGGARPSRPAAPRPPASASPRPPVVAPRPAPAAARPLEPPAPPPPPPARPATVLRKPTTLRPPSSRAVPAIPALAPTPMPRMAPVPAPTSVGEETRGPRELGFRIKPKARPVRRLRDLPPWARKVLVGLAVVAFYFGARALNRYRISFAARDAAIEALIPLMGLDSARMEAGRQHGACFDKAYHAPWGKWQDFSFDQGKHAQCVVSSVMLDLARRRQATARVAMAAEAARRPPSVPTRRPPPPPPRTPPPSFGRVAVGNVKVLHMARSPQMGGRVSFVAIGNAEALASVSTCSYAVTCGGQPVGLAGGQRALAPCALKVQGASATGDLEFSMLAPAPAEGDCGMELTLTDGTRPLSATVVVPLS